MNILYSVISIWVSVDEISVAVTPSPEGGPEDNRWVRDV